MSVVPAVAPSAAEHADRTAEGHAKVRRRRRWWSTRWQRGNFVAFPDLGDKVEAVITRLLGVLLSALAAQYVIDGLRGSFGV